MAMPIMMDMLVCTGMEGAAIHQRMLSYEAEDPVVFYTSRNLVGGRTLVSLCKVGGNGCYVCEVDSKHEHVMSGVLYGNVPRHHYLRADMERDMLLGARMADSGDIQRIRAHLDA